VRFGDDLPSLEKLEIVAAQYGDDLLLLSQPLKMTSWKSWEAELKLATLFGIRWRLIFLLLFGITSKIVLYMSLYFVISIVYSNFSSSKNIGAYSFLFLAFLAASSFWFVHLHENLYTPMRILKNEIRLRLCKNLLLYLRPFLTDKKLKLNSKKRGIDVRLFDLKTTDNLFQNFFRADLDNVLDGRLRQYTGDLGVEIDFESYLIKELEKKGHLVCLGTDDIGVHRIQTDDADWEARFISLANRAKSILYVPGPSPGSIKEFEIIMDQFLSKTAILSVPTTDTVSVFYWNEPKLLYGRAWNEAILALIARRPEWKDVLEKLTFEAEGMIYSVHPINNAVQAVPFNSDNLKAVLAD
jgi:hypothetical protein